MADNDTPDKNDFTAKYNTELDPASESSFQDWTKDQSSSTGRDVSKDLYDYDLRGWWQQNLYSNAGEPPDMGQGHLTDEFKKPNHPTFSTGSIYHGSAGNEGGTWEQLPGGESGVQAWSFKPGATNLEHHEPDELKSYFDKVEPGNELKLPEAPPSPGGLPSKFIEGIKQSEGFAPRAAWDYKQFTSGYGTRASYAGEPIDRETADKRFGAEISKAAQFVDTVNPKLDSGTRAALTSLTFNAGSGWAQGALGERIRAGDIEGARNIFQQYNRAGGVS